jgi:hypothetical protein
MMDAYLVLFDACLVVGKQETVILERSTFRVPFLNELMGLRSHALISSNKRCFVRSYEISILERITTANVPELDLKVT